MNIIDCILKIYPDWKGSVWGDSYEGIRPHELETRPIPTLEELEAVWPVIKEERKEAEEVAKKDADIEVLILQKLRDLAVSQLQAEGTLTVDGKVAR